MSGYIGTQPVPQATQTRDAFTCTAVHTDEVKAAYAAHVAAQSEGMANE